MLASVESYVSETCCVIISDTNDFSKQQILDFKMSLNFYINFEASAYVILCAIFLTKLNVITVT